jgi:hypothetical protein
VKLLGSREALLPELGGLPRLLVPSHFPAACLLSSGRGCPTSPIVPCTLATALRVAPSFLFPVFREMLAPAGLHLSRNLRPAPH